MKPLHQRTRLWSTRRQARRCWLGLTSGLLFALVVSVLGFGSSAASAAPSGKPYVFGTISTDSSTGFSLKEVADGFEAWASYTNKSGGLDGHPVKVIRCDDQSTPQGAQTCARADIANSSVLAVAGSQSNELGPIASPLLAAAGIPLVCSAPLSQSEFTAKSGFCTSGGEITSYYALMQYAVKTLHIKRISIVFDAGTIATQLVAALKPVAAQLGASIVNVVYPPPTTSDWDPVAASGVQNNPGIILVGLAPAQTTTFLQSMAVTDGGKVPVATVADATEPATIQATTSLAAPFYYAENYPLDSSTDPAIKTYKRGMAAAGYKSEIQGGSLAGWVSGEILSAAVKELKGNVTRASLLHLLLHGSVSNVGGGGLFPGTLSLANAPKAKGFSHLAFAGTYIVGVNKGTIKFNQKPTIPASLAG